MPGGPFSKSALTLFPPYLKCSAKGTPGLRPHLIPFCCATEFGFALGRQSSTEPWQSAAFAHYVRLRVALPLTCFDWLVTKTSRSVWLLFVRLAALTLSRKRSCQL